MVLNKCLLHYFSGLCVTIMLFCVCIARVLHELHIFVVQHWSSHHPWQKPVTNKSLILGCFFSMIISVLDYKNMSFMQN